MWFSKGPFKNNSSDQANEVCRKSHAKMWIDRRRRTKMFEMSTSQFVLFDAFIIN